MPPCDFKFVNINDTIFQLFDDNELISSLNLIPTSSHYQIYDFYIHEYYHGYGCFRYLIHRAIDIHRNILSTIPYLLKYWRVLVYYPHFSFSIKSYNNNIINDIEFDQLWFSDSSDHILIQKKIFSDQQLQSYENNQKLKQRCNRDDHTVLYGPNSSGKWCYNT
jgi:hypothetical protein